MKSLLRSESLFAVLLLASPSLGQFDDCSTALVLDPCGGSQFILPIVGGPTVSCGIPGATSGWARMTPSLSGPLTVTNVNGLGGTLSVFSGDCSSLTELYCGPSPAIFNAVAGTTYFFQLERFVSAPSIHASVVDPNCAPNDGTECLQAIPIDSCASGVYIYDTSTALDQPVLICGGQNTTNEGKVWYELVPETNTSLVIDVNILGGPGFNVLMDIFEGTCGELVPIACGDANMGPVGASLEAGKRYTIMLGATLGDTVGELIVMLPGSPCGPCTDCDADGFDEGVDCNDGNPNVYPGAPEIIGDGLDNDCDGIVDNCTDCDGDGFAPPFDCDDNNPNVNPDATEIFGNGIDDDCDGMIDEPGIQIPSGIRGRIRRP